MKQSEATKQILEFFEDNTDVFNECVEDLDSYNGYLGDDRYYCMEELDDLYSGVDTTEILRRAFYGYDEDTWTTDSSGNKEYGAFNPNREYFTFNGYGNLVSADYKDYSAFLDDYVVKELSDYRNDIYAINDNAELSVLFDEYDDADED